MNITVVGITIQRRIILSDFKTYIFKYNLYLPHGVSQTGEKKNFKKILKLFLGIILLLGVLVCYSDITMCNGIKQMRNLLL